MRPEVKSPLTVILTILAVFGLSSASLGAVITLQWDPVTTNENGTPLEDLAGYIVDYGIGPGEYTEEIDIPNPGATTYDLTCLTPGVTYFIALTAYDSFDNVSDYSGEVSGTGRLIPPQITSFKIDSGSSSTVNRTVALNYTAAIHNLPCSSPTHYKASESSSFAGARWLVYSGASKFTLSVGAGTKTIYFKAKNMDGESAVVSDTIGLAPAVTSFRIAGGAGTTAVQTVTLNNTATNTPTHYMASESTAFEGASWQSYSTAPKFTLSTGSGEKTVHFKVKGGDVESAVMSDKISALPPAVTTFKIAAGALGTASESVTLNNTATNSPTHYMASESDTFAGAIWQPYFSAPKFTLSVGGGTKTIHFKVKNSFAESPASSDTIDALIPEVTSFKVNAGALSTANGTVTLNNTAKNSPTHYMASESDTFAGASWQVYSTAPKFALSSTSGTKTIHFKTKNIFGESPEKIDTIDALIPEVTSFRINAGALSTANGIVTLNNTAKNSPTHYMASESDIFAGASWQTYSTAPKFALSDGPGQKTVHFKVKNSFAESAPWNDTISTAGLSPVVTSFKINAGALSTPKEVVTLNNTATNLPMYYMASEDWGFAGASWQTYSTAPKFTLSLSSGTKTIYFKTKNIFGESTEQVDTIDAPAPEVISFKINGGVSSTGNGTVTLNNTAKNSPTNYMASESPTFDGASWQTYSTAPKFTLSAGSATKTVYFKTRNIFGESYVVSDTIGLIQ